MRNKLLLKCLAVTMVASMCIPQSAVFAKEVSTFNTATTVSTDTKLDVSNLQDGKYTVEVAMQKATNPSTPSMADKAVDRVATLVVKDGKYNLTVGFKGMEMMGLLGYLKSLTYLNGDKYVEAQVGSTYDVVDDYNDANKDGVADFKYPKTVIFPLLNKDKGDQDGLVKAKVVIAVMESIMPGAGTQDVLIKVDWNTIKAVEIDKPEKPQEAVDKKPLVDKITEVKKIQKGNKPQKAWETLQTAITEALKVLDKKDVTKADIDKGVADLEKAVTTFNNTPDEQQQGTAGTKITKIVFNNSSYANGLEFPEIDKNSKDSVVKNYVQAISSIVVNGTNYVKDWNEENQDIVYELTAFYGLRIKTGAFKDGENEVIIKATNYKDKKVVFTKEGDTYKFVSQEDVANGGSEVAVDKKPLTDKITEAKAIKKGDKADKDWKALQDAIAKAESAVNTVKTQDDVTNAVKELQTAIDTFKGGTTTPDVNKLEDGEYTLTFVANSEATKTSSMLQGAFDPKVKLVVKDGQMKISMLNTALTQYLLDFSIESNKQYPKSECKELGIPNSNGQYPLKEFTMTISNLDVMHKGAVLVTAMGGQISDIGKYEKYTKLDMTFGKDIEKGWKGYQYDIDNAQKPQGDKLLEKILVDLGHDTNNDGKMSVEEIEAIFGELDLSGYGLSDISLLRHLSDKVTTLDITGNNIQELPAGILDNMTGLENFYASNNFFTDIPKDFFKNNSKLKWVKLSSNAITSIEDGDFNGLTAVEELDLENNMISKISDNAFAGLHNLKSLSLSKNELTELPSIAVKDLDNLTGLYMAENKLTQAPKAIESLSKLENLYIDRNNIKTLANVDFSKAKNLTRVVAKSNRIAEVKSGTFSQNKNLEMLDLYDNDLTEFTADVLPMITPTRTSIRTLDLQLNNIKKVDENVRKLIGVGKFQPQKTSVSLDVKADEKGNLKWSQELSLLDLLFWYDATASATVSEIKTVEEYKDMVQKEFAGKDIVQILDEKGYDWDIKTQVQKKNADGTFTTVDESLISEEADKVTGEFKTTENGTYRVLKTVYPTTYGSKEYRYSVVSDEVEVGNASVEVNKTDLQNAINKAKEVKKENKTDKAWETLQNEIKSAQNVFANEKATQEQVNSATAKLIKAIEVFKESADVSGNNSGNNDNASGNNNNSGNNTNNQNNNNGNNVNKPSNNTNNQIKPQNNANVPQTSDNMGLFTTLLSMILSAFGVSVAINHRRKKNKF